MTLRTDAKRGLPSGKVVGGSPAAFDSPPGRPPGPLTGLSRQSHPKTKQSERRQNEQLFGHKARPAAPRSTRTSRPKCSTTGSAAACPCQ